MTEAESSALQDLLLAYRGVEAMADGSDVSSCTVGSVLMVLNDQLERLRDGLLERPRGGSGLKVVE
jgi:hypothetical protein